MMPGSGPSSGSSVYGAYMGSLTSFVAGGGGKRLGGDTGEGDATVEDKEGSSLSKLLSFSQSLQSKGRLRNN